jgi:hypothetical protein
MSAATARPAQPHAQREQDGSDDEPERCCLGNEIDPDHSTEHNAGHGCGEELAHEWAPQLALGVVPEEGAGHRDDVEQQVCRGDRGAGDTKNVELERQQEDRTGDADGCGEQGEEEASAETGEALRPGHPADQQQWRPCQAPRPSLTATPAMTSATRGSAQDQPNRLLRASPSSSTAEM